MTKSVFGCVYTVVALSLLGVVGCYAKVEVSDSSAEKAIAIDWVEPPCAEPGSAAGYIEGNGFGAENVTITVGGIEAEVLTATGMDASFVVPEELPPGPTEVVVTNPGGRIATINWVVCGFDCSAIDCDDGNECTTDSCDPAVEECVHTPVGDGEACDFGGLPGVCIAGLCAEDPCTDVDCDPPVITGFDFNPKSVDVSSEGQAVTCTMGAADDGSGVERVRCFFYNPSRSRNESCLAGIPSSGDRADGVWTCSLTIPSGSEPGVWTVESVVAYDLIGNSQVAWTPDLEAAGWPTELDVTSSGLDTDPPVITGFDFNPKSVDVSSEGQAVTCTMGAADDGSGVERVRCFFYNPSRSRNESCLAGIPSSGDRADGVWTCSLTIPSDSEPGVWTVESVVAYDLIGNSQVAWTPDLEAAGWPTELAVTSSGLDTDPPVITGFDFNPKSVDVSSEGQAVTCTMGAADDGSGVERVRCFFYNPSRSRNESCLAGIPSSGDRADGVWTCSLTIPSGSEPGVWTVESVVAYDLIGNSQVAWTPDLEAAGWPTELDVTYGGGSGPDVDPPELIDLDFNPKQIDVSSQSQDVTCSIGLTDSGVGVDGLRCAFISPSGGQGRTCNASAPSSGDVNNGTWTCDATIPQGSEAGTWVVNDISVNDALGNSAAYRTADLQALGFPTDLNVTSSGPDTDPPELVDFDFNPKTVDVSSADATVTCSIGLTDSGVGVDGLRCAFISPSGGQGRTCNASAPSSGDVNNGTWTCDATIPQGSEAGTWVVNDISVNDALGNSAAYRTADLQALGFPTDLNVTSSGPDTDPPELVDFDFNPKTVDVSSADATVTCSIGLTDSGVGVDGLRCAFISPSGGQGRTCNASAPSSGDVNNGTWTCDATIPQGSEAGIWVVNDISVNDALGNSAAYRTADLQALGFPTQLDVIY